MRVSGRNQIRRRNVSLPANYLEKIATIREQTDAASDSEVIRRALRIYEGLLKDSVELIVRDRETGKERTIVAEAL